MKVVEEKGRIHSKCSNIIKIASSCLLSVYIQGSSDQEIDRVPLTPLKVRPYGRVKNELFSGRVTFFQVWLYFDIFPGKSKISKITVC